MKRIKSKAKERIKMKKRTDVTQQRFSLLIAFIILFMCSLIGIAIANNLVAASAPVLIAIIVGILFTLGLPAIAILVTGWVFNDWYWVVKIIKGR